jgi:hypothetical protein
MHRHNSTGIALTVVTVILVCSFFSQGIKAQATLSRAPLKTLAVVPSNATNNDNTKPNVTNIPSNNTSHQADMSLLTSPKSSPVSSVESSESQKQLVRLSQGQKQQQVNQSQQQQQLPQPRPLDLNQVLPPSFLYQLQQQQPQPQPPIQSYPQQPLYSYQYPYQQQQPLVPPIANAGVSQIVDANTNVMLDGRNSFVPILQQQANTTTIAGINNNKMIIAYQWIQLPVGVPVNITNANTPTPTFTAPMLPYDTTLAFSLRVMSNDGLVSSNQAVAYVMVKHYSATNNIGSSSGVQQPQQQQQLSSQVQQQQQPIVPSQPQQSAVPPIQQQLIPSPSQQQQPSPAAPSLHP